MIRKANAKRGGGLKRWSKAVSICLTCALLSGSLTVLAEETGESAAAESAVEQEISLEGQLTLEDISALNGGAEKVYSHNGRVTFVDGTCAADPVTGEEEAAAVVDSMMTLIGSDANTEFVPWRSVTDPLGNHYYIFQQMYQHTTVCGGAVKVITDPDGNMIGLTSSVESKMPDVEPGEKITAQDAKQIVVDREAADSGRILSVLSQYTSTVILPSLLKFDIESEDESSRFAWVVYTDNPSGSVSGTDLPYLAHYVSMTGEYLYNIPAITPDDEAGRSGYDSSYVFEFMEPAEYTGYVDMSDGSEKEITVTLMRDTRTGMYYLGNLERKIVVAQCYDFLYDGGKIVLEYSPDNLEWDQVGLLSLYNYCRAWDYYNEIGWVSGDGEGTPIIVLNNFCDDHRNEVNNACYVGKVYGMQVFLASKINEYSQCLDVIAHEFTHCVTGSLMTYNSYMNDYGAINEAMSDLQGKNCDMMGGDVLTTDWILGSNSKTPVRSMSDPHRFQQPEFTWDLYYKANVETPTPINDYGGVHSNSSLLNYVGCMLVDEGGMTLEDARLFWFITDCAMVPGTDYPQLAELLPWVLKTAGMEQYEEKLEEAIQKTRLGMNDMPETLEADRAMLTMTLPKTEAFDTSNWTMTLISVDYKDMFSNITGIISSLMNQDFSILPESARKLLEEAGQTEEASEALSEETVSEEESKTVARDLITWILESIQKDIFSSNGSAGMDGSTINMIVRPGRCIPQLLHAVVAEGSQEPDQVAMAIYINGKWYDLGYDEMAKLADEKEAGIENSDGTQVTIVDTIIKDVLGENMEKMQNIRSLNDVLDLFTVEIKGGEVLELSPEGLEDIVIPEPKSFDEKPFGTIEPGPKSRPKVESETAGQAVTEEEELEEAA